MAEAVNHYLWTPEQAKVVISASESPTQDILLKKLGVDSGIITKEPPFRKDLITSQITQKPLPWVILWRLIGDLQALTPNSSIQSDTKPKELEIEQLGPVAKPFYQLAQRLDRLTLEEWNNYIKIWRSNEKPSEEQALKVVSHTSYDAGYLRPVTRDAFGSAAEIRYRTLYEQSEPQTEVSLLSPLENDIVHARTIAESAALEVLHRDDLLRGQVFYRDLLEIYRGRSRREKIGDDLNYVGGIALNISGFYCLVTGGIYIGTGLSTGNPYAPVEAYSLASMAGCSWLIGYIGRVLRGNSRG